MSSQDFQCAICKTDAPGANREWNVDHCHDTSTVRGLLCVNCNIGLGQFKDSPAVLQMAITYLQKDLS